MTKTIQVKDRFLSYELERKNVKNINLRIKADQSIYISANESVLEEEIENLIKSKTEYIFKALDKYADFAKYAPKPKEYVDGESFCVAGHELRLKVVQGIINKVESDRLYITLTVKDTNNKELKKRVLNRWINHKCKLVVTEICRSVYPKFEKYNIKFPEIRFRNMISRWGSCQPKRGLLTFNYLLIEAPVMCIEYVVMHEFTHFLQPNHSKAFYTQLSMFMPDWKERKEILEKSNCYAE